jgi:hypothetical protein
MGFHFRHEREDKLFGSTALDVLRMNRQPSFKQSWRHGTCHCGMHSVAQQRAAQKDYEKPWKRLPNRVWEKIQSLKYYFH